MTFATLVLRGLRFHARTNLGVLAGCALSTAVLAGALFVGDSARASLSRGALARLGGVVSAMETGSRTFADDLPARMKGVRASAGLRVAGMALRDGRQVNAVDVIGVDASFFGFGQGGPVLRSGDVALGARLAEELGARAGDEVSLRVFQPGLLSRDAPLASRGERETRRGRYRVAAVLSDGQLGRFSLKSDQSAPANAFLDLGELQRMIEREGRANLLVTDAAADRAQAVLREAWRLEDAGLAVRSVEEHAVVQLQTPRIYLDPAVSTAALAAAAPSAGMLSYLVDALEAGGRSTPYSFMTALTPGPLGPVPPDMADDEILVNRWVADHLSLKKGDALTVKYSELVAGQTFEPRQKSFRVRDVLAMESLAAERALVPDFPGLTDVEACADWDIGLPMDEKKLNDEANEKYWKDWKQTPKAFVTLAAGRAMWANPFGDLMAVRWRAKDVEPRALTEAIRTAVDPAAIGLLLRPVRDQALAAAEGSMDLGQLFLGLSLFLVAASLLLTALLFAFAIEQRAREMGVLLAVGHRAGRVRGLFLAEGAILALGGALVGLPLGGLFATGLLAGLSGAWSGAVAGAAIAFHATAPSAAIAALAGFAVSFGTMALAAGRQARRPVRELVAEDFTLAAETRARGRGGRWAVGAAVALAGALAAAAAGLASDAPAPAFFAAGALALAGGVAAVRALMGRLSTASTA
ncbi:MAG TPA: FtsX-like permease family protein, partial [Planctomycetota bacterium]|nr:FtsX-like permease family protein [Planctomycetota bacterium]